MIDKLDFQSLSSKVEFDVIVDWAYIRALQDLCLLTRYSSLLILLDGDFLIVGPPPLYIVFSCLSTREIDRSPYSNPLLILVESAVVTSELIDDMVEAFCLK
jgi:hypothetical protein